MIEEKIFTKQVTVCNICEKEIEEEDNSYTDNDIDICPSCGIEVLEYIKIPYDKFKKIIPKLKNFIIEEPILVEDKRDYKTVDNLEDIVNTVDSPFLELKDL